MWRTEWKAISDSIEGLKEAASFHFQNIKGKDTYGVSKKILLPIAKSIQENILKFCGEYQAVISDVAYKSLTNILIGELSYSFLDDFIKNIDSSTVIQAQIVSLVAFRAEFTYVISDSQATFKRVSERSFEHLQRSIIADNTVQERWQKAFIDGETSCEKLGSAHLLMFGIWAFKSNAEGERTDLIFQDIIKDYSQVEKTADALVLTEWKLLRDNKDLDKTIKQARSQAKLYSKGSLAGIELSRYRYLVIVSEERQKMPPDDKDNDITYVHINIAVNSSTPSKQKI